MNKYIKNIHLLINMPKKEKYDKTTKYAISKINNQEIFTTEFLMAKQFGYIDKFKGHSELKDYLKLIPFIFNGYSEEIFQNIDNKRFIYSIFDGTNRRIFHVIDENSFLISVYLVSIDKYNRQIDRKFKKIKNLNGGTVTSHILSPAEPFWRHLDFIEQLYQKLKNMSNTQKTILITRHDKIGDFITALPMCKILKEQTSCKIVMMVSKVNIQLASQLDFIDEVIEYSDDSFTLLKRLNNIKADVSISGYIDNHLGLCLWLSRIPIRISPATKLAQIFFNKTIKQRRSKVEKTEWRYNLDLVKFYDESLILDFQRPLLNIDIKKEEFVIFHTGFGGSSDGNLTLDDYLKLAKKVSKIKHVVFTFGPDDDISKKYIKDNITFEAVIRDDFKSLYEFTEFIATSLLFVSTSTGPMHLAGLTNTTTFSFFGINLFASSKRWATISEEQYQHNFEIPLNYDEKFYKNIENKLMELI